MSNEEISKAYEPLRKKFSLPDFDAINNEFEIGTLESADFLLRGIRDKTMERIEYATNILHPILQPDTNSFNDLQEFRAFTDEEKKHLFSVYGKLMVIHRTAMELSLINDDKLTANFINDVFKKWPELKQAAVGFVRKIRETWEKESVIEEELGYLG